jgi:hypothetical protein
MNDISPTPALTAEPVDYERDFAQWIERQAELLRANEFEQLDLDNLVEEIEDMGKSLRRELRSRLEVLILHLLKCEFQPERTSSGWIGSIGEQRSQILLKLRDSPSLNRLIDDYAHECYPCAVIRAAHETGLAEAIFPARLPYSRDQLLDMRFLPGP